MKVTAALVFAAAGTASAKTISIASGQGGLTFQPDDIKADIGDILEFSFHPANHSVAQGSPTQPCQPVAQGGFFSGYQPVTSGTATQVFRVRVNDTNPIYFYCTQPTRTHCQAGMVGVVNAPANRSVADYRRAAAAASGAPGAPASIFGGQLASGGSSPSSSSTSGSPATTSRPVTTGTTVPSTTSSGSRGATGTSATPSGPSRAAADNVGVAMGSVLGALAIAIGLV